MQEESGRALAREVCNGEVVLNNNIGAILSLLREVLDDSRIPREVQLPCFNFLLDFAWTEPIIFIYEGDAWPAVIHPYRLVEVSRSLLRLPGRSGETATRHACPPSFEEGRADCAIGDGDCAVQVSRFELVSTVYSVESYRILARRPSQLNPSGKPEYNQLVGSAVVRVITTGGGVLPEEKAVTHRITQLQGGELCKAFFHSFIPLIGGTMKQLEKAGCSCVTAARPQSVESGGISSSARSNQPLTEERSLVSPHSCMGIFSATASVPDSIPNATPVAAAEGNSNSAASFPIPQGAEVNSDFSLRWEIFLHLFAQEERYRNSVESSWANWTSEWDKVNRFDVVDSIDCVITSLRGSREAVHVAAAYLDAFVCMSPTVGRDATFFSGILLACSMVSCKQVDRFFPPIRAFLRCLRPEHPVTAAEFRRYEVHVLKTLNFCLHPVTSLEMVELLLQLCGGPAAQQNAEKRCRLREKEQWSLNAAGGDGGGMNNILNNTKSIYDSCRWCDEDAAKVEEHLRWGHLCRLARFITDLMLRNTRAQEFRCSVMGLAILAVAAEKTPWALPMPLAEMLPESSRVHSNAGGSARLDCESYELLTRYAAKMRCRSEQDGAQSGVTSLWRAVELVRGYFEEFSTGRRSSDDVLQRRYGNKHATDMSQSA
ncbi:putative exportin 1, putative,RNA-nuclear export factor [Trypanosoma conorhini]|uniref:Putative exportin 1, putative,RNA-nuclear export factor n=1 Tax=Trypanosoma conorhini TaxID=83891 RepID=A0A422NEB8_9TRYP|nr:putative exportin 1, putative,RNA-nuclear export factor [Trypanosoma conorhini]RNF03825.1 putative exportin 1, putative,RNA-nuclear export factor [Trypanosoma conorhini]